jgi:hypothetical protein
MTRRDDGERDDEVRSSTSAGSGLSKGVYGCCYFLAYGAVYASHLAMEVLPPDSMIRHGLQDGASAARRARNLAREEDQIAEDEMELPADADAARP